MNHYTLWRHYVEKWGWSEDWEWPVERRFENTPELASGLFYRAHKWKGARQYFRKTWKVFVA